MEERFPTEGERHLRRVTALVDTRSCVVEILDQAGAIKLAQPLVPGTSIADLLHPDDLDKYRLVGDWCTGHPGQDATIKLRFLRGLDWWLPLMATLKSGPPGLTELCLELDDAVKARAEATQMRQVVEGSQQGIAVRNRDKVLYVNNGYARLLGYSNVAELIAQSPVQAADEGIHPDDRQMIIERVRARLEGREAISQYEFRLKRRDGSYIWLEAVASRVQWDGAPASLSWLIDISARKQVEVQLIESREAAERANKAKSNFLASMSHELRTPLNAIIGFSDIMRSQLCGPLDAKYGEYAADIHKSGEHLLALINDVLDMSKLEAGKVSLREDDVRVEAVLEGCLALVRHGAQQAGLEIVEQVQAGLPAVRADERALKQVVLNFLSNAVKFTPRGGAITVRAALIAGKGVELSVSDTGIGMSEDGIKVAMEPFGQVDSAVARENPGTGLGLPISYALMRLHGGDISIASAPGRGTTLTARLPLDRVLNAAA